MMMETSCGGADVKDCKYTCLHKKKGYQERLESSVTSFTHAVATGLHICDCVFNLESPETLKDSHAL